MSTSNKERQRRYRENVGQKRRINTVINTESYQQLDRIAIYSTMTKRELLEMMIDNLERETVAQMEPEDKKRFFGKLGRGW